MGDYMTGYLITSPSVVLRFLGIFLSKFEFGTLNFLDQILAISTTMRDFLIRNGVKSARVSTVTECVAPSMFSSENDGGDVRAKLGAKSTDILVMFHGILAPWKGIELLVPAFAEVRRDNPQVKLVVVGEGPLLGDVRKQVHDMGLKDQVVLTGWIPFDIIPQYIAACNVGVVLRTKTWANSFVLTTALMQYLSSGKPVVAPRLSTISEILPSDVLFEPGNAEDLSRKLIWTVSNLNDACQKVLVACTTTRTMYSASSIAQSLENRILNQRFSGEGSSSDKVDRNIR
jgi:glycosyltransferase involved in cell wall biosynthesis